MNQHNYDRSVPHNNGNQSWPARYPVDQQYQQQQRQQVFERSNFELRSLATNNNNNNNGYYGGRPSNPMSRTNNFEQERQPRFNSASGGYNNQQSNYDPNFIRAVAQVCSSIVFQFFIILFYRL